MPADGFRLSPQQKRVWRQRDRAGLALRTELLLSLEGELDTGRFREALHKVTGELEILRTAFRLPPGLRVPVQVVEETCESALLETEVEASEPQAEALMRRLREGCGFGQDLAEAPLLRNVLARDGDSRTYWYVVAPAVCSDGPGMQNYVAAVARAYAGDADVENGDGPLQYADVAEWQSQALEAEEAEPGREYWRQHAGDGGGDRLPFEGAAEPSVGFEPAQHSFDVPTPTLEALERLAGETGDGLDVVLLAAYRLLLYRLSGSELSVLGVGSVRAMEELREVVGLLRQDLPLPLPVRPGMTARELLREAGTALAGAVEWQDSLDPEQLEQAWGVSVYDRLPFTFEFDRTCGAIEAGDVRFLPLHQFSCLGRFKLRLSCRRSPDQLAIQLCYDPELYRKEDIELCEGRYLTLLESIAEGPDGSVGSLSVLPAAERRLVLHDLNRTDADLPPESCIHDLVAAAGGRDPAAIAVVHKDRRLTYGELLDQAKRLAARLAARGAGPGVRVGLCIERSVEMIVGILGILSSGAAYVPLDPKYPRERLAFMTRDSGLPLLVTTRALTQRLDSSPDALLFIEDLLDGSESAEPRAAGPDDPAYVIYTSGSTGQPKGVQIAHRNLVSSTAARRSFYSDPVGRFLLLSSFAFDSSVAGIFWTLSDGGTLCLPEQGEERDVQALARLISEHRVTHTLCLPSLYSLLLSEVPTAELATLTDVIVAGEACTPTLTQSHHRTLPGARLHNEYGPTEATVWATACTFVGPVESARVPIGRPIANARVYVLDEGLEPVPFGCPGELVVGGAGVAPGYLDRDELTRERFLKDPFSDEADARMYRTGDIVRHLEDGSLDFLGRADGQIKIRGYRVELGEIESALTSDSRVSEAVASALDEDGHKRLVGYLTIAEGASRPSNGELRELLKARLPEYMVPAAFVVLERFPQMPNGKVDRSALPAPDWKAAGKAKPVVPPRNDLERELVEIWGKVLRIDDVGVQDNYFELGGDSILSIRMVSEAHRRGLQITPMQLFSHQTISELAGVVGRNGGERPDQGPVTGPVPLTPIQRWWLEQRLEDAHHWNMSTLLDVREPLDLRVLERAAAELVSYHDVLRLRIERTSDGWSQRLAEPPGNVRVERIDLSSLPEEEREPAFDAAASRLQASLDISSGPVVALGLFELSGGASRLLFVVHHLAVDGVSWPILLEDLATAYGQLSRGEDVRLLPKTTSYRSWSERLQALARETALEREAEYWSRDGLGDVPRLPRDLDAGPDTVGAAAVHTVYLPADLTAALLRSVPETYRTQVNDALLTAVLDSFSAWTGRPELLITLEGHGREDVGEGLDVSRTVGWFTSLFPVTLARPDDDSPGERLKSVKEQLRAVPRRGIGYGLLRYLREGDDISGRLRERPQSEVGFNYLGQFDPELGGSELFRLREQSAGAEQSPEARRRETLEIVAMVAGDRLRFDWIYSENRHRRETIAALAEGTIEALDSLIEHCRSEEAGGYTPSDFPEANLDQEALDRLITQLD